MDTEPNIIMEQVDDLVLLIQVTMRLGLPAVLDRYIPRHWLQKGLSWGWVVTIWLAHIMSQGDHRKLTVQDWVAQAHTTLEETTGLDTRGGFHGRPTGDCAARVEQAGILPGDRARVEPEHDTGV